MNIQLRLAPIFSALLVSALPACASSSGPEAGSDGLSGGGGSAFGAGGLTASAGLTGSGGMTAVGGIPGAGGVSSAGGTTSAGGAADSGGAASTGGVTGLGGVSGSGGATSSGGTDGAGGAEVVPHSACVTKPSQVILMGDSYINWVSHTFPTDLFAEAGATFRNYAIGAYSMGSGGIGFIPTQLDTAIAADPDFKVIILDGGGNDILVPDVSQFPQGGSCKNDINSPNIPDCQKIVQKALDTAGSLMDRVVSLGVTDVVYFFYPRVPEGTLIGGTHPNAILEYAVPRVKALCDGAEAKTNGGLRCHFVDLIPVFDGHLADWFAPGDIHPNNLGSQAMAKAVWQKMKDVCVGQPSTSACCQP